MGRVQVNKAHKCRFSSKSTRNLHKTSLKDKNRIAKSEHNVAKGARAVRIQRNKMLREQKKAAILKEKRASSGSSSPPRVIVLFGLSASVNIDSLAQDILQLLSPAALSSTVASSEYKIRATVLKAPHGDLSACMEMAKVADLMAFVTSADEQNASESIDSFGSQCLSVFRSIGLPSTIVFIRDLPIDLKQKNEVKKRCVSSLATEFPEDCKFYSADTKDDLHKFLCIFREQRLTLPHWRNQRPYLMSEKITMVADDCNSGKCTLLLTGYLHGLSLSVNQLVHLSGAGDFQLQKIEILKDRCPLNPRKEADAMDSDDLVDAEVVRSIDPDPLTQEPLLVENIPDPLAGEQTWPTEAEMAEANENQKEKKLKKRTLPRGTSEYQAAWIVDDSDGEGSDSGSDDEERMALDEADSPGLEAVHASEFDDDQASLDLRNFDEETEIDSVMMEGDNLTREQIEDDIRRIKEQHAEDEEFPDEVETPLDIPARKRFAKYRGLKSLRTSSWDPKESLPPEYARIFAFDNFARTQKHVCAKALEYQHNMDSCVPVGHYVRLHIKEIPSVVASKLCILANTMPIIACGLLQHESKLSVLHFSIKKHNTYDAPIKSKEELVFHVGFRQFVARPLFSSDNIHSDKHQMERFLHAGRFSIASVYAPISFLSLPLVVLKRAEGDPVPRVAAVGSLRSIDPDRIILKKIILTGYPQRVSKLKASVRYMFHTPEDVRWFKPVEVWTKCGRRGRIREPVGTHGAMKCIFNGILQQNDTVCMSLFKRAYPKLPEHRFPILDA
ncbi:uncharacterized protein LOC126676775 [Mercurialis annua]|uniref:uncharacterized protein LOC126676775 n=1 Tax=Mercurialis annua TaxID=3986 RepID=UPI002160F53E|nr:uncharacterized protein LOC126676775 [Mercurialis annua]